MQSGFSEAGISIITSPKSEEEFVIRPLESLNLFKGKCSSIPEKYKVVLVELKKGLMKITDEFEANFINNPYEYAKNLGRNKIFGIFINKNFEEADSIIDLYKLSVQGVNLNFFLNLCEKEENKTK